MNDAPPVSTPRWLWWVALAALAVWFFTLDFRHLIRSDEGRYAEMAREMWATGDWVTIRYNGIKYFEKPPFHLWMTALAYHLFGAGEWQARLWVAISGMGGLVMIAWAAARWYGPRVGWLAALALLAAPTWNVGSHFNSLDMGVSGALACVLAALLMAQHPQATPGGQRRWMWVCWVAMGVAVLTKGLIGLVLPGLVLVVYTLLARDWALWRRLHLVSGMAWLLLVTAPWFVLVSLRNPEFAHFFFIHEHWQRYTTTVHQRMAPWWYFGPQLLLGFLPWLGLLPRMGRTVRHEEAAPSGFRPALMLAVWAVAIVLFFSASGSKLPGYILPVFPALAVLAALALDGMAPRVWVRQVWTMLVLAGAGLLVSPLVERATSDAALATQFHAYAWWVGGAFALVLLGLVVALMLHRRAMPLGSMVAFALAMFVGSTVILQGHETMGRSISGVDLVPRIQSVLRPDMPIYSVRLLDHTLPFYLGRTTIMVEQPDELEFGLTQEPAKWQPTLAGFRSIWSSGPRAVAIMSPATYVELKAAQWPMYLLTEDDRRVVVTNFISPPPQP